MVDQADEQIRQFAGKIQPHGGKTNHRVDPPAHLGEQNEAVSAAQGAWSAVARPGRGSLGILGRVTAGSDGLLEFFHLGQLCFARSDGFRRQNVRRLVGQQGTGEAQAAVAPQGQLPAVGQVYRHRARGTGLQLLADKQAIPFDQ